MFLVLTPLASCLRTSRDDKIGMLVVVVVVVVVKIVVGMSVVVGIVVKTVVVVVVLVRGQIYFSTIVSRKYKSTSENLKNQIIFMRPLVVVVVVFVPGSTFRSCTSQLISIVSDRPKAKTFQKNAAIWFSIISRNSVSERA